MRTRPVVRSLLARGAAAAAVLTSASFAAAQVAPGASVNPRAVWSEPPEAFTTRVVATGFEDPWEVTWGPDGFLWITERVGKRVVRVNPADGSRKVAVSVDDVHQKLAQDGLLGLAVEMGGRLVQHQQRSIHQVRSGECHPLPFAGREAEAVLADHRVEAGREPVDQTTQSGGLDGMGDAVLLDGPSRHWFHGVDRILPGTSQLLPEGGRFNLTLRRVTAP